MKPTLLVKIAAAEHAEIADELSGFRRSIVENSMDGKKFLRFCNRLKDHMFAEEEILFPALGEEEHIRISRGLEYEHAAIWMLVDKIASGISRADAAYVLKKTQSVSRLLSFHSRREEETVYSLLDACIKGADAADLTARMKSGTAPGNWICRYIRDRSLLQEESTARIF
jgi:hemerythrin superfamily protein